MRANSSTICPNSAQTTSSSSKVRNCSHLVPAKSGAEPRPAPPNAEAKERRSNRRGSMRLVVRDVRWHTPGKGIWAAAGLGL